jgi:RNA polymerase sigma-70 factor, ECF subfamily
VSPELGSDAEIVARLRQGDRDALARLYDDYSGLVYGVSLRVLRNAAAAEDIVQEVFLMLWRNPSSYDEKRGRLAPWLAVMARNKSVDVIRKLGREADPEENPAAMLRQVAPAVTHGPDAEKAAQLMARLPADQRKTLEMAFLDGLTHSEIAARTGEALGTVKSRIRLGLAFLRKELTV